MYMETIVYKKIIEDVYELYELVNFINVSLFCDMRKPK